MNTFKKITKMMQIHWQYLSMLSELEKDTLITVTTKKILVTPVNVALKLAFLKEFSAIKDTQG